MNCIISHLTLSESIALLYLDWAVTKVLLRPLTGCFVCIFLLRAVRHVRKDERKYYEELLKYSRDHLILYPYHLSDIMVKGLRVTPFSYYIGIMEVSNWANKTITYAIKQNNPHHLLLTFPQCCLNKLLFTRLVMLHNTIIKCMGSKGSLVQSLQPLFV